MTKKFGKEYFDEKYKETDGLLWGREPSKIIVNSEKLFKRKSKILDLGCGEGKDALFLAKKGHKITAIDISESAINKLNEMVKEEKLKIKTEVIDLLDYKIKEDYDVIIALASIHFISKKKNLYNLIKKIKSKTKKKGYNIIAVFRKGDSSQKEFNMYYFDNGELLKLYFDWKIIKYVEFLKKDKHGEKGKVHDHKNANLITQKIKAKLEKKKKKKNKIIKRVL